MQRCALTFLAATADRAVAAAAVAHDLVVEVRVLFVDRSALVAREAVLPAIRIRRVGRYRRVLAFGLRGAPRRDVGLPLASLLRRQRRLFRELGFERVGRDFREVAFQRVVALVIRNEPREIAGAERAARRRGTVAAIVGRCHGVLVRRRLRFIDEAAGLDRSLGRALLLRRALLRALGGFCSALLV